MSNSPWNTLAKHTRIALAVLSGLGLAGPAAAQTQRCPGACPTNSAGVNVCVVDLDCAPIANGFRWLLEEDNSYGIKKTAPDGPWAGQAVTGAPSLPGTPSPSANFVPGAANPTHTLTVNVHKSSSAAICAGDTQPLNAASNVIDSGGPFPGPSNVVLNASTCPGFSPLRNYHISILPWRTNDGLGYTMTGRSIAAGQRTVTGIVQANPQPTAQITVLVFEDIQPINAAFDQPDEAGLANFTLLVSDMAGLMKQDAFTYPLGTTYKYACTLANGAPCRIDPGTGNTVPLLQGEQPEFQMDPDTGLPVVDFLGDGNITTCPGPLGASGTLGYSRFELANCIDPYTRTPMDRGEALVRYTSMNKYAIEPVPPPRNTFCGGRTTPLDCSRMLLTGTLEGTRQNDAWVRAGEPRYNIALGQLNWLAFYGFVNPMNSLRRITPGPYSGSIHGRVVQVHEPHPPNSPGLTRGLPIPDCFVGLNNLSGNDEQVYTAPCNPDSTFDITGVPPGTYELVMWDKPINAIIDFRVLTVAAGQSVQLGDVAIFGWFGTVMGHVFYDAAGTAVPPGGLPMGPSARGVPNVPVNLHFTDGSFYQTTVTDGAGAFSFNTYFAWWRFLVAEVGAGLGKPTGLTAVVDNGGDLPANAFGALGINPQPQVGGALFRTEVGDLVGTRRISGPVTEAVNVYADMTAYIDFGAGVWDFTRGENGGIRGMVNYATTRTEEDPKTSATDGWEPGIPNVTVLLHKARRNPDPNDPTHCLNDLGNLESNCWIIDDASDPRFPQVTTSDSWNDNIPDSCIGFPGPGDRELVNGFTIHPCAETFINWDQTRPGVFDGAFSFDVMRDRVTGTPLVSGGGPVPIPAGYYIVEVIPPTVSPSAASPYKVLFWGDRNIEFGDPKVPFLTQPPDCVGPITEVPAFHTLFPDQQVDTNTSQSGQDFYPGLVLPACNLKVIALNPGATGVVNFNLFTFVPKAARIWGTVWNDLMLEFNPASPNAAGNLGVSFLPVSIRDWSGVEVVRAYTDQWGHFDVEVTANYDIAPPIPIGLVVNQLTILPNDPGPVLDTRSGSPTFGQWITDPWFNPAYSQEVIRENWEFYPGRTTFVDTIVIPTGAFVGNRVPLNCAYTNRTPEILQVDRVLLGPTAADRTVRITSKGTVQVPNPTFDPTATSGPASQPLVSWDHSFGPQLTGSQVTIGGAPVPAANILSWTAPSGTTGVNTITVQVPVGQEGQVVVTRGDSGLSTTVGVTLHNTGAMVWPPPPCGAQSPNSPGYCSVTAPPSTCVGLDCARIQPAIDRVFPGSTIIVMPGKYQEHLNLWKPITLQGLGAAVTQFDGTAAIANLALKQQAFNQLQTLIATGAVAIVPGQASNFTLEEGSIILVAGCGTAASCGAAGRAGPARRPHLHRLLRSRRRRPDQRLRQQPQGHQQRDHQQPGEHRGRHPGR
jgi:large repetitive protein